MRTPFIRLNSSLNGLYMLFVRTPTDRIVDPNPLSGTFRWSSPSTAICTDWPTRAIPRDMRPVATVAAFAETPNAAASPLVACASVF